MRVPRLDTVLVKNNDVTNNKQMRIPADLNKPVLIHFNDNKSSVSNNSKLNYLA